MLSWFGFEKDSFGDHEGCYPVGEEEENRGYGAEDLKLCAA